MAYPYYQYQNPYQPQSYLPPNYQPINQQAPPAITQSGIIWVSGEQEAAMYPIAPNNAVTLWDKSGKTVYVKQADATGKPSMTTYDLVKRDETSKNPSENVSGSSDEYVKKSELAAVGEVLSSLKADIDTMKGDLYGVAGRKRIRKTEVTEDVE